METEIETPPATPARTGAGDGRVPDWLGGRRAVWRRLLGVCVWQGGKVGALGCCIGV